MLNLTEHQLETNPIHPVTLPDAAMSILTKIATRQAVVSVIGLGYVGLPLAVAFAEAGFSVIGIDVDKRRVSKLNAGESYIPDIPSEQLKTLLAPLNTSNGRLMQNGTIHKSNGNGSNGHSPAHGSLSATTQFDVLRDVDAVVICVPTPLSSTKDPDMSFIASAVDEIAPRLHPGMLIVLESTTYPGTTEEVVLPQLENGGTSQQRRRRDDPRADNTLNAKLVVGRDFFLAFSPERIDPGRVDYTVRTTPKVIGGVTPICLEMASALYATAIQQIIPVSQPKTAEMVKLLENTFRAVNIGLINEMAIMCNQLGIDIWEVIEAAKTKPYGFMPFYPGPGLGGHCLPIDPLYLAWKLKTLNYNARFIQLAAEVNFGMPHYVLGKIADALNSAGKPIKDSRVLVLGVAYKADIGDMRESPALELIDLLRARGAEVQYHDPFVPHLNGSHQMDSVTLDENILQTMDCVVVATAHSSYDWKWLADNSALIVDTRNALRGRPSNGCKIVKL